jgi:hypothetical protein
LISRAIFGEDKGGWFEKKDNEILGIKELDVVAVKKVNQDMIDGKL